MVDTDDKVVIIDVNGIDQVLFKPNNSYWNLEGIGDFSDAITQLGSIEVNGVQESDNTEFTVDGVDYSFNSNTKVITPDLDVE